MNMKIFILALISLPLLLPAQIIAIKTVPLSTGNQFNLFPSQNLSMGGISIALDDPLADAYENPAMGAFGNSFQVIVDPAHFTITDDYGSGLTVPLHISTNKASWFGGVSLALQKLNQGGSNSGPDQNTLSGKSNNNSYFNAFYGRPLSKNNLYWGASVFWASLNALEGVDLLHRSSSRLDQEGNLSLIKLGLVKLWQDQRRLEALLAYEHFDMTQDVYTNTWSWIDDWGNYAPTRQTVQTERDKSNTWAARLNFTRPLGTSNWRIGYSGTANWKSHPKIPNYELMNIPRDPGNSYAYQFGIGLAKINEKASFGFDLVYEPIWSHTWANAIEQIDVDDSHSIYPGQKTFDNRFEFSNWTVAFGFSNDEEPFGIQLGLNLHVIDYNLKQHNYLDRITRKQNENWWEWYFSWGFRLKTNFGKIYYVGRFTQGTGLPGVAGEWRTDRAAMADFAAKADFLVAPQGSLTVNEATVLNNQIIISIPLD